MYLTKQNDSTKAPSWAVTINKQIDVDDVVFALSLHLLN